VPAAAAGRRPPVRLQPLTSLPEWLGGAETSILTPGIDPGATKNLPMSEGAARAILQHLGLAAGVPAATPGYDCTDGSVHVACLPLTPAEDNAAMVNAIQRLAAVVVKKSLQEGFGLGVTEAMWKARPIVASAVGGHLEQVRHRHSGLLVADPADAGFLPPSASAPRSSTRAPRPTTKRCAPPTPPSGRPRPQAATVLLCAGPARRLAQRRSNPSGFMSRRCSHRIYSHLTATWQQRQVRRDPSASFSGRWLERAAPAATRIPDTLPAMYAVMARSVAAWQRVGTVAVTAVGMFADGAGFGITPLSLMSLDVSSAG
jgi:Glycosyl transferases group 1